MNCDAKILTTDLDIQKIDWAEAMRSFKTPMLEDVEAAEKAMRVFKIIEMKQRGFIHVWDEHEVKV